MSAFEQYIEKGGQRLRLGYTTGSCAAAAAKAAALMLLSGQEIRHVRLMTPKGIELVLEIEDIRQETGDGPVSPFEKTAESGKTEEQTGNSPVSPFGGKAEFGKTGNSSVSPFEGKVESGKTEEGTGNSSVPPSEGKAESGKTVKPPDSRSCPGKRAVVSCAVRKDSGDDPDITNEALIYASVALSDRPGIRIDGGEGVGRVTKPGLDQPVGSAAINSTPRRMIEAAVREVLEEFRDRCPQRGGEPSGASSRRGGELSNVSSRRGGELSNVSSRRRGEPSDVSSRQTGDLSLSSFGLDVTIFVPRGRELAAKTFNPKLGIVGGISILGTSGIVEPMSDPALLDTIRTEISVRRCEGLSILAAAPGNYGKNFFLEKYGVSLDTAVTASNFIHDTVRMAGEAGFTRMLFVGHIGKLVKVAGGIRNTHSKYGDHRMEILGRIAEELIIGGGTGGEIHPRIAGTVAPEALRQELEDCVSTDEAVRILRKYGLDGPVLTEMTRRIRSVMESWTDGRMQVEVIVFSNVFGELGKTPQAVDFLRELRREGASAGRIGTCGSFQPASL